MIFRTILALIFNVHVDWRFGEDFEKDAISLQNNFSSSHPYSYKNPLLTIVHTLRVRSSSNCWLLFFSICDFCVLNAIFVGF